MELQISNAEKEGLESGRIEAFISSLKRHDFPLHSILISKNGKIVYEDYAAPYTKDSLHRMFSTTKSMVSLAIGCLIDAGKLSLDDHIIDYFPEYVDSKNPDPFLAMLTIRDMLTMRTSRSFNAYKSAKTTDYIKAFFTEKSEYVPGTTWAYDTSSTHVLSYLVEKLSGKPFLDFLKEAFLNDLGFSKDSYVIPDPSGIGLGGSGLMASSRDLLRVMLLLRNHGNIDGKQYISQAYIDAATSLQSDPFVKASFLEESVGYGYQFWITRNGGYAMYGMAGQMAIYDKDTDTILITTGDCMNINGGIQLIYDGFFDYLVNPDFKAQPDAPISKLELPVLSSQAAPSIQDNPSNDEILSLLEANNGLVFKACPSQNDIKSISLHFKKKDGAFDTGYIEIERESYKNHINFGIGHNLVDNFEISKLQYAASCAVRAGSCIEIYIQILDSSVGSIRMTCAFRDDYIAVTSRKYVEDYYTDFNFVFSGKK